MDVHAIFVGDEATQTRFRRAIRSVVRTGDVVLDLGTGTGVHALFACRAGASRVYAVDRDDVVHLAGAMARRNGCEDRMVCIKGQMPCVDLPERVDVIVTNQGLGDTVRLMSDARARFLKPGGRVIPSGIRLFAVPLESSRAYREAVRFWTEPRYGLDLSPARQQAQNTLHDLNFGTDGFLARPAGLEPIDLNGLLPPAFRWSRRFMLARPGILHGLGAFFEYRLAPGVTLSTRPPMTVASPPWRNVFFPFDEPRRIARGDRLDVDISLSVQPAQNIWGWRATASRRRNEGWDQFFCESHSTLTGLLRSREALEKLSPDTTPALTRWGEARRAALTLCDGRRRTAEIEAELLARYPELFVSRADVEGFVAETLVRDAV